MKLKCRARWGLPAFTLLLILGGAFLPYGVAGLQDAYIREKDETKTFEDVRLTLHQERGIDQILELVSKNSFIHADWKGETNLSVVEAINAAEEILTQLLSAGLLAENNIAESNKDVEIQVAPSSLLSHSHFIEEFRSIDFEKTELISVSAFLCISEEGNFNAILWECVFPQKYTLWIDDASAKMVKITGTSPSLDYSQWDDTALTAALQAERWQKFLQDYYEMEIQDCTPSYRTDNSITFQLQCRAYGGNELFLPLILYTDKTFFN